VDKVSFFATVRENAIRITANAGKMVGNATVNVTHRTLIVLMLVELLNKFLK